MDRIIGLDLGSKTCGVSICDALHITCRALTTVRFESDDYDTIGGYCLELLDHVPTRNESIYTDEGIFIRIDRIAKNRIEKIYIKLPEQKN